MGRESLSPPPKEELSGTSDERQEVAYHLASYLLRAKSDKKAAEIFSHTSRIDDTSRRKTKKITYNYLRKKSRGESLEEYTIPKEQIEKIDQIREELTKIDQAYLEEKKENFSTKDRAILLFKAKTSKLNGLSKEEKIQMYEKAGYTEDEILKISGKKLLISAGLSTSLAWGSDAITGAVVANEKIIPFLENIPEQYNGIAVGASLLAYIGSYAYITEKNLRLTKEVGASTNTSVTGIYLMGNRLVSNRTRDWLARGIPIGINAITHTIAYPAIIEGVTANPDKIIAGSLASAAINIGLASACELFLRRKAKKAT